VLPCNSSLTDTSLMERRFRNFISDSLTVIRISQVENWDFSWNCASFRKAFRKAS